MFVTLDNFFINSIGKFTEIYEIPKGFTKFFDSKTSIYYTNNDKTQLIRISDHWGKNIKKCTWYLSGYPNLYAINWKYEIGKDMKIGIIEFSNLKKM